MLTLLVSLAVAASASAAEFAIPISVQEPCGVARQAEPISGGLPLPKGRFPRDQAFALFREDGREAPCQTTPLVVETDGTLRWVLLDFQDDIEASATRRYVLRAGRPSAPAARLRIDDRPEGVEVDTGVVRVAMSKRKPFGLFDRVTADGRPVVTGGEASYEQLQGRAGWNDAAAWTPRKLVAGPPESVRLCQAGPLRATVEVKGRFADDPLGAGYQAWITLWAGKGRVAVKYKLCNSNPAQFTAVCVRRSALELRLGDETARVVLGAKRPLDAGPDGWIHQGLLARHAYVDVPGAVRAGSGAKPLWTGDGPADRPAGWIASAGGIPLLVVDQLFSSNPARRLALGGRRLVLEGIAEPFDGVKDPRPASGRRVGRPWQSAGFWLYDCSHHSSEYLFDFAPPPAPDALDREAAACRGRLWALAPGTHHSECEALGVGRFGTLEEEQAAYRDWGWKFKPGQASRVPQVAAGAFVAGEDNHGESEADSVQGLLLMHLRTGRREWFDLAEAWARYHMDLQAWRTDGWAWKDGAIWFPSGGPQGNLPTRKQWNFDWGPNWGRREKDRDCADLWLHAQSKSCYCHFYGSGLADWFCLTGDLDALEAARDNVEQKDEEFRRYRKFVPGKSEIGCIRGFGRGFEVMLRVLEADPGNGRIADLCHLAARTLWQSPLLDERGFHASRVGGGFGGMPVREITPPIQKWMDSRGVRFAAAEGTVDTLSKDGRTWPVVCYGGTWQHVYIQNGADLYAQRFDDEDLRDYVIGFAEMSRRYLLSPKCRQTWYYTYFDVPDRGMVFDPWAFEHTGTSDGEGCVHSGWYTRFYPDACARGYSLTGERALLDRAREFWDFGSKREYQTKRSQATRDEVNRFAGHEPPKDDTVLSAARLFYEASRPPREGPPPAAVTDLVVRLTEDGKAEVCFTAPAHAGGTPAPQGGGRGPLRYQLKAAPLPIADYDAWDPVRDAGRRRNWWKAVNCRDEPAPAAPGARERFTVSGVPAGRPLHFALRTFDACGRRSAMSNVAEAK